MLYRIPKWLTKYLSQEDKLTIQASNYLRANKIIHHHTFNEGKRSRTMQSKIKGFGVMTGIPDFLIFHSSKDYNGLAIELKVIYKTGAKNRLSPKQKEAQNTLSKQGWKCVTVWDFDQFEEEIKKYFKKHV